MLLCFTFSAIFGKVIITKTGIEGEYVAYCSEIIMCCFLSGDWA